MEAKGYGWLLLLLLLIFTPFDMVEDEEGEIERLSMECAILVCEFDGRMIETGLVEIGGWEEEKEEGGGESDPYLVGEE